MTQVQGVIWELLPSDCSLPDIDIAWPCMQKIQAFSVVVGPYLLGHAKVFVSQ